MDLSFGFVVGKACGTEATENGEISSVSEIMITKTLFMGSLLTKTYTALIVQASDLKNMDFEN